MIEPRYTVPEVATLLRESTAGIYRSLHLGLFPGAYKRASGGRTSPWVIPESAIQTYLASR